MSETVSVRMDKDNLAEIGYISELEKKNRSDVLRDVLELGIHEKKLEIALEKYRNNEATASKAAKLAGVPLSKFLEAMSDNGIDLHYGIKELEEDIRDLL